MNSRRVKGVLVAVGLAALAGPWALRVTGQNNDDLVVRERSPHTGRATFAATGGAGVPIEGPGSDRASERALRFIERHGAQFGLSQRGQVMLRREGVADELGIEHVRFQQLHHGVPVTGSEFIVHLRGNRVIAANGDLLDVFPSSVTPAFPADSAVRSARAMIEKSRPRAGVTYSEPRLEIFNRGRFESRRTPSQLAWFVEASGEDLRQYIWVDARTNEVLFHFSQLQRVKNRQIHTANGTSTLPGALVRSEGQGPTGNVDQDNAYAFAGSFYDFFFNAFGRDSYDNAGAVLRVTTQYVAPGCPDLFWNGAQLVACQGYGTADDVIAHEFAHALIQREPDLFAFGQSGAIGESLADIFGETIDQLNGLGNDAAGQRWVIGEDLSGGALRHMMTPAIFGDPGKMSDAMSCDLINDHGGIHSNSGIPNHAYALMVDGGSFNGFTIAGIGLAKASRIQYRAMTTYLTVSSSFKEYVSAVAQSCTDLAGSHGITVGDCTQVTNAMRAVELDAAWGCAVPTPEPALCPAGGTPNYLFQDGFESGLGNWAMSAVGAGTWGTLTSYPKDGALAAFGLDVDTISDHRLAMATSVALPANARLAFDHLFEFEIDALGEIPGVPTGEGGFFNFDGGVLEYSTNGGASWLDAGGLIDGGLAYGGVIDDGDGDFGNPLLGRAGFVGYQPDYQRTRLNLASLGGQSVRIRFRIGTDESIPDFGWLVDNVGIYTCGVPGGAPTITAGPQSQRVAIGSNVVFSVTASGTSLSYQWLKDGVAIPGATASTLARNNVQDAAAGTYSVIVSNGAGTAYPDPALLTVIAPGTWTGQSSRGGPPLPIGFVVAGNVQSLTQISAEGTFNSCNQSDTLPISTPIVNNTFDVDTGPTQCGVRIRAQGTIDSAFSATGTVIMNLENSGPSCAITCNGHYVASFTASAGAPTINAQPDNRTAPIGSTVQFVVGATGTPAPTYQWQISTNGGANWSPLTNTAPYSGVMSRTLIITGVSPGLNGFRYRAVATNALGAATSAGAMLTVGGSEMIQNGSFASGTTNWVLFATPDQSYISWLIDNGVFKYFRQPPPPGTQNQAVIFQETGIALGHGAALTAGFDLGNSSAVRKRVSVLILDADFSDLTVCTFWLPANAPMRRYQMRTHTTEAWTSAAIYFYAATPGSDGGHYMLDNVSMQNTPAASSARTDCIDPIVPAAPGGADSASLIVNGDFSAGMGPWGTFGTITHQINQGIFQFLLMPGTPSGVVLQPTGAATSAGEIISARFELGNSSAVRKRVTVLLHDLDFSDLHACTFYLPPGLPLTGYTMRTYSVEAWSNATISIYPATVGAHQWMQLDNVSLQRTPSASILGTECVESPAVLIGTSSSSSWPSAFPLPTSWSASLVAMMDPRGPGRRTGEALWRRRD